jgi:hypothetical protein
MHTPTQPVRPFASFTIASPQVKTRQPYAKPVRVHRDKRNNYNRAAFKRGDY